MPRCVNCSPVRPPTLLSFTPPVSGLFPPTEMRSQLDSMWPTSRPGTEDQLVGQAPQVAGRVDLIHQDLRQQAAAAPTARTSPAPARGAGFDSLH